MPKREEMLRKIEEAYREGRISEETYLELKRRYSAAEEVPLIEEVRAESLVEARPGEAQPEEARPGEEAPLIERLRAKLAREEAAPQPRVEAPPAAGPAPPVEPAPPPSPAAGPAPPGPREVVKPTIEKVREERLREMQREAGEILLDLYMRGLFTPPEQVRELFEKMASIARSGEKS